MKLLTILPKIKDLECFKIGGTPLSDSFVVQYTQTIRKMKNLYNIYIDSIILYYWYLDCSLNENSNNILLAELSNRKTLRSLSISCIINILFIIN